MTLADTIVAISTPRGASARGVIRLSGDHARACVDALFLPASGQRRASAVERGVSAGTLRMGEGAVAGCRIVVSKGPRSFTGEDVVEVHLAGAPILLEAAQEEFARAGARLAQPGEFTRRAFVNGRIDLTRAEAVLAVIRARDESERRAALATLEGGLERRCAVLRDRVLRALVPLELGLDFSDQDIEIPVSSEALDGLRAAAEELALLSEEGCERGAARTGFRVVLEGAANAGKSSLFNHLLGDDAALVTPIPGTTRDVLTGELELEGFSVELVDTAGDDVEEAAADTAAHAARRRRLREADLILEVRDVRQELIPRVGEPSAPRRRVGTHADLVTSRAPRRGGPVDALVANPTGAGVEVVRRVIADGLREVARSDASRPVQVNARQAGAFRQARMAVEAACDGHASGGDAECVASDLHAALMALQDVTGEVSGDALLDRVFSDFCIGK